MLHQSSAHHLGQGRGCSQQSPMQLRPSVTQSCLGLHRCSSCLLKPCSILPTRARTQPPTFGVGHAASSSNSNPAGGLPRPWQEATNVPHPVADVLNAEKPPSRSLGVPNSGTDGKAKSTSGDEAIGRAVGPAPPGAIPASRAQQQPTSRFRGVRKASRGYKWQASVWHEARLVHLGTFDDEEQAARAYDRVAIVTRGEKAKLNFDINEYEAEIEGPKAMQVEDVMSRQQQTSRFRGVCWDMKRHKWRASIWHEARLVHLGRFDDEKQAARAYDRAAIVRFGEKAKLNFDINEYEAEIERLKALRLDDLMPKSRKPRKSRFTGVNTKSRGYGL